MVRLVLDTNVFVSALISGSGPPARLIDSWRDGTFEIVVSEHLVHELEVVLSRQRFSGIEPTDVAEFLEDLRLRGAHVADPPTGPSVLDDPADEFLVQLALAGAADAIVSGDAHLTRLPSHVCRVLTPREAVELLGSLE